MSAAASAVDNAVVGLDGSIVSMDVGTVLVFLSERNSYWSTERIFARVIGRTKGGKVRVEVLETKTENALPKDHVFGAWNVQPGEPTGIRKALSKNHEYVSSDTETTWFIEEAYDRSKVYTCSRTDDFGLR